MTEKKKNVKKGKTLHLAAKVLATSALISVLCSMAPRTVSSYTDVATAETSISQVSEASANANRSLQNSVDVRADKLTYTLPGIPSTNLWNYTTLPFSVNGKSISESAAYINGIYYLPLRAYFAALGANISYNSSTKTMTVSKSGLYLTATHGGYVIYANDRPIFNFSPNIIMSNGRMYVSMSSLMKITGQTATVSAGKITISGTYSPLAKASAYYRDDEVLWLARIITAEARGESLLGQIAVGNVILNRVNSRYYPNTIYGVIFDRKYGVQFSPVLDGSIYNTPTYNATLAAKICLEGTRLSTDAMFFLNPKTAESSWIIYSREYAYSIGGHDFYK